MGWMDGWMGWDGRLSPSASLLRAPYGANNNRNWQRKKHKNKPVHSWHIHTWSETQPAAV